MTSPLEEPINQQLKFLDFDLFTGPDPEDIGWATILAAAQRRYIMSVDVDKAAAVTLEFEGGISIRIDTDVDIVNWQWCVTKNYADPYLAQSEIACLWKSTIEIEDGS